MISDNGTQAAGFGPWINCLRPKPEARLRLFCFPYAGGGSFTYRSWDEQLPPNVEVCPVQLPGRETRLGEPLFRRLADMIPVLARALAPFMDKPFSFFGHSMGAMISFELARQLRREGWPLPLHLFASGQRAPQLKKTTPITYDLPEPEFLEELRRLNGTPKEVLELPELMQLLLPLLRADFEVCQTYRYEPEPPLDCPITAFGGVEDEEVKPEQLLAWREQTAASFAMRMFPGDHFFLHAAQKELANTIGWELGQLAAGG